MRELWEAPLEARIFRQVYTPLRAVHARHLRLHDRLLRAATLTLREVCDVTLLRASPNPSPSPSPSPNQP